MNIFSLYKGKTCGRSGALLVWRNQAHFGAGAQWPTENGNRCQELGAKRGFNPWVRKIPRRREWQPTPVFLPGNFREQRSLAGYSPWGPRELDMTEHAYTRTWDAKNSGLI